MLVPRTCQSLLFVLVAACWLALAANPALAGGCSTSQQPCTHCPPNDCDCPCYCESSKPNNYVYKALDKVAGGIEKLLGLDKLNCDSCCGNSCCDKAACDDCCDSGKLKSLRIHGTAIDHTPIENAPVDRPPAPPAPIVPYLDSDQPDVQAVPMPIPEDQRQEDQWLGQPQTPSSGAPVESPSAIEPEVIEPPVRQPEPLTNPFRDDVKVNRKPLIRAAKHEQSKEAAKPETSSDKHSKRRLSRSYTPSKRLVRTLK